MWVRAEDISLTQPRPLMALCAELQDKHGLLVTYEDAPTDPITETRSESRSNGRSFLFPKSEPITFHVSPELPTLPDSTAQLNGAVDISQSVAAVQELVKEYNDSGNPGKFTVLTDGKYSPRPAD